MLNVREVYVPMVTRAPRLLVKAKPTPKGSNFNIGRTSFPGTVPTLAEAAIYGETEELKGVTENVIVGLPIPVGTGIVDLYMG